jgi:dTDP-4-amino-4,6-dideoxygalactose transaminase
MIPFNKPYLTGKENHYIYQAVASGKISGDGIFTKQCHDFFETKFGFKKCLLTTSCTDALEMAAILINIEAGDEVIMPSYTFVSTSNAFVLRGAKIVFADSDTLNPNLDVTKLESLITNKTKAIVPVHYAGIACDMDAIMELANKYNLFVIEDAAQALGSKCNEKLAGTYSDYTCFSFQAIKHLTTVDGGAIACSNKEDYDILL